MKLTQAGVLWGSVALACTSIAAANASSQSSNGSAPARNVAEKEAGIPVKDALVREKCGTCHRPDEDGNLSRISWVRTTPEQWAQVVKRMVTLNGLSLTPDESRAIVRSLSASHGLAPEEAAPIAYIPQKRIIVEDLIPNEKVRDGCASCHAFGQPLSWRRSGTEWSYVKEFHAALYSQAAAQYARITGPSEGTPPKTNGDVAIAYLKEKAPLHTPEWAAWSARQTNPELAGKWLVTATVPGKGRYAGTMDITKGTDAVTFGTVTHLDGLEGQGHITRKGEGYVYAGFMWRGVSAGDQKVSGTADVNSKTREALDFTPDQQSAKGRWFWGEYHEFGYDVELTRATAAPVVLAFSKAAIKAGTSGNAVTIVGHNLPTGLTADAIRLGAGLSVGSIVSSAPDKLVVTVDAAADAAPGLRDLSVDGVRLEKAFSVYSAVDFVTVTPDRGMARLGGGRMAPGYVQFDAFGMGFGPDGKPNTADDVNLGRIDVNWSLGELPTTYYDDDTKFVGKIDANGLFAPNIDGPNNQRRFGRNNYGEVWAVATAKNEVDAHGRPLTGRGFLLVTVPSYQRWDQPEVSE